MMDEEIRRDLIAERKERTRKRVQQKARKNPDRFNVRKRPPGYAGSITIINVKD